MAEPEQPPPKKKRRREPRMTRRARPTKRQMRSMIEETCPTCRNGSNRASCPLCEGEGKIWVSK
jgi:hypothetical protein